MTSRPPFIDCWRELAQVAADLLKRREESYPRLIEAGKLDAGTAETSLRAMRAILVDWQRLTGGFAPRPDAPQAYRFERRATLEQAMERCRAMIAKGTLAPDYLACVEALLWHENRPGGPGELADANFAMQRRHAAIWAGKPSVAA